MTDILPHQNPVSGPLSFRHMYNVEYRPGEDELINYRVQRRKRMESVNPCPKCGDECECGPDCNCGSECECCGIVSEAISTHYKYAVISKKSGNVVGITNNDKDMPNDYKYVKLKKPLTNKDGKKIIGKPLRENTLIRFKNFIG